MPHPCSGEHGSYDLALRRKLSLFLDILDILRFVAWVLLDLLGVVSFQDNELPGESCWGQHHVDTAAMERLMEAALRSPRYMHRRRRRRAPPGGDNKGAGAEDDGSATICTICLAALEVEGGSHGQVAELSSCSHTFHAACRWLGGRGRNMPSVPHAGATCLTR
ncbi:hypothetical protein ABZP36_004256 [Zizania latifolia]